MDDLLERLPCGILSFTDDGYVVAVNGTLLSMVGRTRESVVGHHVEGLLTVGGRIFFQTHLYPLVRLHGRAEELFVLLRHVDGHDVGTLLNAVRNEHDGRAVTDCVFVEVRERKRFEEALLRAKQAAESARAALEERTLALEEANEKLESQALELEFQQRQLQEQAATLEAQGEKLRMTNNALLERSDALESARAAADEANRAKSQFLAVMSHELRTPLNAIGGYVQLLELGIHGPVTDAQREALDRILRAQRHLMRLINDVLNLARIEAGRVEYAREDCFVADLIAGVMPMVEPQMASGGLTVQAKVPADIRVSADREKVQQILINLLTNAVKFTPAGGRVSVIAECDQGGKRVLISVADTGTGIPQDKLATIFEPFVQIDAGPTRRQEGSGLGLAISRDLARGMGGDLFAESAPGEGSTFMLALPGA